ncbi:MAG: hypothetical protein GY886_11045 [Gammaproteobacteria bacterium]|nr:hypothetical protein [Gammaproteobacteria bacterium]MCP4929929.1 hypothetical protein [Gammaproteobacteria bacterium]
MTPPENTQLAFGIHISLPKDETFTQLIDSNRYAIHWCLTQTTCDLAMQDICREHEYSHHSDRPTLGFGRIEGKPS